MWRKEFGGYPAPKTFCTSMTNRPSQCDSWPFVMQDHHLSNSLSCVALSMFLLLIPQLHTLGGALCLSCPACSISYAIFSAAKRFVEVWVGLVFFVGAHTDDVGGDSCSYELSYCLLVAAISISSAVSLSLFVVMLRHTRMSPH